MHAYIEVCQRYSSLVTVENTEASCNKNKHRINYIGLFGELVQAIMDTRLILRI